MATSNFETARKTNLPKWRQSPRPEFAHIDLSEDGRCRNRITMQEYHRFHPSKSHLCYYVSPTPNKATGVKEKNIPISILIYEAFHNVILPPFTKLEHVNGVHTDDRIENLRLKGAAAHAVTPATITVMPTIRPEIRPSSNEQRLTTQELRWIERQKKRIEHIQTTLICSSDLTPDILAELDLDFEDMLDTLPGLDSEQQANLFMALYTMIVNVR